MRRRASAASELLARSERQRRRYPAPQRATRSGGVSTIGVVLIQWRPWLAEPLLEIDDLHVAVDDHEILRGVTLAVRRRRGPRPDGPQRLGQVDPGQHPARPTPPTRSPRAASCFQGEDITALAHRRAGQRAACSSASSTPRRSRASSVLNFLRQAMAARKGITTSRCSRCGM